MALLTSVPPGTAPSNLPVQQSFTKKLLTFAITLTPTPGGNFSGTFQGTGVPGADGTNQVTLSGVRAIVHVENNGAPAGSRADISIYGLTPSLMNQLTTVGIIFNAANRNYVTISAGDAVVGPAPIFTGTIIECFADYNQAPNVPLVMTAQAGAGGVDSLANTTPSSFAPPVNVATVMAGFARRLNLGFINGGVSAVLPRAIYLRGNLWQQVNQLARWQHIHAESVNGNTLAIWPYGGSWQYSGIMPLISKNTGMIGSPSLTNQGVIVKMIFNPQVGFGGKIQIQSAVVPQANGIWYVQRLDLDLATLTPNGKWQGTVLGNGTSSAIPTPQPTT